MLTLNEIRNVNFRKANFGGYRAEDVEAFIDEVQLSYDTLLRENAELVKKLEVLAAKLEEYQSEEDSIRNALMNAQKVGDASLRDAKHKAEIILKDATIKAEKIISSAQSEIHTERDVVERMQRDIAEFKTKLLRLYKEHLALINNLPNEEILRPDTREMVDSVQMLDRRAAAPSYDRQPANFPNARAAAAEIQSEPSAGADFQPEPMADARPERIADRPERPETGDRQERSARPAVPAPVMPPEKSNQRRGGFTVDIGDENSTAGENRTTPPAEPAPSRRAPRFATTFEDEVAVDADPSRFSAVKVEESAGQQTPGEGIGGPASLFRKRRGGQ